MKIVLSLCFVILLAACAPALTPSPSTVGRGESPALTPVPSTLKGTRPVGESSTPAATRTPVPPTATATATPMPQLTMEDLKSMSVEDKLKMAPQAESAPKDVVSSFAAGESARDIAWSGKSLTFWDRVVAYEGTTRSGEKVTLYYDLESGQWAKQYQNFDEVSKIPADKVPDVMVVNDENGAHLVRNKFQYDYDWISQPQVMIEGKMVFRDDKGYPKAVFDTNTGKWMTPEEADVVITKEKWIEILKQVTWVGDDGVKRDGSNYLKDFLGETKILTTRDEIMNLPVGSQLRVYNPSGEITFWMSPDEAAKRFDEGAVVQVNYRGMSNFSAANLAKAAFQQGQAGNKNIFLTFGDLGINEEELSHYIGGPIGMEISDIPQMNDGQGHVVSPVVRLPKHPKPYSGEKGARKPLTIKVLDPVFWLDQYIKEGVTIVVIDNFP